MGMEEQTAYCVIDIAQKADAGSKFPGQDKTVPWQICHGKGSSMETCHSQVGIDSSEVQSCLADTSRIHGLMQQYITRGANVHGTPLEQINGKEVGGDADYYATREQFALQTPACPHALAKCRCKLALWTRGSSSSWFRILFFLICAQ